MELLSPAGNLECGIAAFEYGADAVYLGLQQFSARADADNFDWEDLAVLLGIAHRSGGKVYVAINTVLRNDELPQLIRILTRLQNLAVDALIVQDLAVWQVVRTYFPEMVLHASTQMAIHNRAGVEQAKAMGFSRVIAARELTLAEIRSLCSVPDMEIEVFGHGALCHAYSGLCQLSSYLRGTSGNRGDCSYVCRNCFTVDDNEGNRLSDGCALMSMKDLASGELVQQLREAGVVSLKIEGRKKTPLYVSAVTNYYRNLLDDTFAPGEKEESERHIKSIFSRPWTEFFLRASHLAGITDIHTVGPRGVEVGEVSALVYGEDCDYLRFQVRGQGIEKHDGLQVELSDRERPYGFGVEELHVFQQGNAEDYQPAFSAEPGQTVEVPLPEQHPDIPVGRKIFCASSQAVKRSYCWESPRPALDRWRLPVSFLVRISASRVEVVSRMQPPPGSALEVVTGMNFEEPLQKARKPEGVHDAVAQAFSKLGDTSFAADEIQVENPGSFFVRSSQMNDLRRQAVLDLMEAMEDDFRKTSDRVETEVAGWKGGMEVKLRDPRWILKIDRCFYLNVFAPEEMDRISEVVFAIDRTDSRELPDALKILEMKTGDRSKIRLALSPVMREDDGIDWNEVIAGLYAQGWKKWQLSSLAQLQMLNRAAGTEHPDWTADWQLYAQNSAAAKALMELGCRRFTLSPDDEPENMEEMLKNWGSSVETVIFEDVPLAYSAACANASLKGFCPGRKNCTFTSFHLVSRKGEKLVAQNNCCQTVYYAEEPMDQRQMLPELFQAGARFFRADFIWREYSPLRIHEIWKDLSRLTDRLD